MPCCLMAPSHYLNQCWLVDLSLMEPCTIHFTHWGWVMHICVCKLTIIGSDNGLLPGRRQAIIWTNVGIFLIATLGTNFSEILGEIYTYTLKKCIWKCHLQNGDNFVSASMCWMQQHWKCSSKSNNRFENYTFKIKATFPSGQWVKKTKLINSEAVIESHCCAIVTFHNVLIPFNYRTKISPRFISSQFKSDCWSLPEVGF